METPLYIRNDLLQRLNMVAEQRNMSVDDILNLLINSMEDDIIERQRVEDALQASEVRFRQLFDAASEGFLLVNDDGIIVMLNSRAAEIFGYTLDELEGCSVEMLLPQAQVSRHIEYRRKFWGNHAPRLMGHGRDLMAKRRDGSEFPLEISLNRVQIDGQALVMCIIIDISARKQLEQQHLYAVLLQLELEKERELIELKERFISMVSHEYRTPLTIISSSSEILERYHDRLSKEQILERVRGINAQTRTMVALLDDVLTLSRVQSGRLQFAPALVDVDAICREIVQQIESIDPGHHAFAYEAQALPPRAMLDKRLLEHILMNLLSNAMKYSPGGSTVSLTARRSGEEIIFEVCDEGIGIPKADHPRLFEPFHRGSNVDQVEGTGLGLSVVQKSVETHGGSISFDSVEGRGTRFTVRLPFSG